MAKTTYTANNGSTFTYTELVRVCKEADIVASTKKGVDLLDAYNAYNARLEVVEPAVEAPVTGESAAAADFIPTTKEGKTEDNYETVTIDGDQDDFDIVVEILKKEADQDNEANQRQAGKTLFNNIKETALNMFEQVLSNFKDTPLYQPLLSLKNSLISLFNKVNLDSFAADAEQQAKKLLGQIKEKALNWVEKLMAKKIEGTIGEMCKKAKKAVLRWLSTLLNRYSDTQLGMLMGQIINELAKPLVDGIFNVTSTLAKGVGVKTAAWVVNKLA